MLVEIDTIEFVHCLLHVQVVVKSRMVTYGYTN